MPANYLTFRNLWNKIDQPAVVRFYKQLYYLLDAGINLQNALKTIEPGYDQPLAQKITGVRNQIFSGTPPHLAFADFPYVSPEIQCLIKVGEDSSSFAVSFLEISRYFEDKIRLKQKIWRALAYPVFVLLASLISLLIICVVLLPNFKNLFAASNVDLPSFTRFFIEFGVWVQAFGGWVIFLGIVCVVLVGLACRSRVAQARLQTSLLKMPLVSGAIKSYLHLRIVKILATLLNAQIPLAYSLHYVQAAISNPVFARAFSSIITKIESGETFGEAAQSQKIFSPLFLEMLRLSEETGKLGTLLKSLGQVFEEELEGQIRKMTQWLEPVATLAVGGFVFLIAFSMLSPMAELMNGIK